MGEINLKKHSKQLQAFLTKIITIRALEYWYPVPSSMLELLAGLLCTVRTPGMQTEDPEFKISKKIYTKRINVWQKDFELIVRQKQKKLTYKLFYAIVCTLFMTTWSCYDVITHFIDSSMYNVQCTYYIVSS